MAEQVQDCLVRYGLQNRLHVLCMDNASNCNKLAVELAKINDTYRGMASRTRCFAHITNIVADVSGADSISHYNY